MSETNYWSRVHRRRLSRRTLLGASARAGVGAAGLALVGCGDDDDDDGAVADLPADQDQAADQAADQLAEQAAEQADEPADEPADQAEEQAEQVVSAKTRGGTLRFSTPAATHDFFDPHRAVFGPTQFWMGFYMNSLIRWQNKEKGILEADVTSLPEIPDEETYVFGVSEGARFWDQAPTEGGREVTADDVRFNMERRIDAVDATGAEDGTFLTATSYQKTVAMEVIDNQTITMKTDGPDATYLSAVHGGPFSWVTSPEAADVFGDAWRDETTNVELSSGTGMMIPESYSPDTGIFMNRNPNYWKAAEDGGPLPLYDRVEFHNITDATAVEAAYRSQQFDSGGFPLSKLQVEGIQEDFPDHKQNQVAFGFTIQARFNFNPEYPGEDGNGLPWVDRRVTMAFHMAVDRFLQGDTVYLGDYKPSALPATPWFNGAWTIPADELLTFPGYRPDRDLEITELRQLLDASGIEPGTDFFLISPDIWEGTYPGIVEVSKAMYENATEMKMNIDVQPYTVILQRLTEGTYPGDIPSWTNPPSDLDPTNGWANGRVPGGSSNLYTYDHPPVTALVERMQVTLDVEERKAMAREVQLMMLGQSTENPGFGGISPSIGVVNGIQRTIDWPYVNADPDVFQFAHASHRHDGTWLDTTHADFPA